MNYSEILALVCSILVELLRFPIEADTRLDLILKEKPNFASALKEAIKHSIQIDIETDQILKCLTVRDLADVVFRVCHTSPRFGLGPKPLPDVIDGCKYKIWYGTNRLPTAGAKGLEYTAERDSITHYGVCDVYIPKSHKIGSLGSPWWKRVFMRADDRLQLVAVRELVVDDYWSDMGSAFKAIEFRERDAVVYIHGYNVSFADATLRAAQIGADLSIKGGIILFSWPSRGERLAYLSDEASIEASEGAIEQFLIDVASRSCARAVHIIAHSMGNRGVLRAINRIATTANQRSNIRFDQIILAAPDIDVDLFRRLCEAYKQVSNRTTLYVSEKDRAIRLSDFLHKYCRVGLIPPVCVVSGIDTVNVSNVDLTLLGHGYVAEARGVLADIYSLIRHNNPPDIRFGLRSAKTPLGEEYWVIGG